MYRFPNPILVEMPDHILVKILRFVEESGETCKCDNNFFETESQICHKRMGDRDAKILAETCQKMKQLVENHHIVHWIESENADENTTYNRIQIRLPRYHRKFVKEFDYKAKTFDFIVPHHCNIGSVFEIGRFCQKN